MAIEDIRDLREHLQWAIEIEHATIPAYLCALYSIPDGVNPECADILRSVFMEEMLHLTLAANLLNAVGGSPQIDRPGFVPAYPARLPHSGMAAPLTLRGFSRETVEGLMAIERPETDGAPAQDDHYETIGQFYEAIGQGLLRLCRERGPERVLTGDPARQVGPAHARYHGAGKIIPVLDLGSALEALAEIVEQGEGMDHESVWDGDRNMYHSERDELGHHFRLHQILEGRFYCQGDTPQSGPTGERFAVDWAAVPPMRPSPRLGDHPPGSRVRTLMEAFSREYAQGLRLLHRVFNGAPEELGAAVGAMYELRHRARALMSMPLGDGTTAGPSFEPVPAAEPEVPGGQDDALRIEIRPDGPYVVHGAVPLLRKDVALSELDESLAWRTGTPIQAGDSYALCRCGASRNKPFCDGSHVEADFDGTESAPREASAARQERLEGTRLRVRHDASLCAHAGFCFNRANNVRGLLPASADIQVRTQITAMVERCPSGALSYDLAVDADADWEAVEPHLPGAVAVTADGPLWVTGGIPLLRSDGHREEVRNRVTLCRCGRSANKPFCDGTHAEVGFSD